MSNMQTDKPRFVGERVRMPLSALGKIVTGNTPSKKVDDYWAAHDIPFIKPNDIGEAGVTFLEHGAEYIANEAAKKARLVGSNAVLVTCIGTIAKVAIVDCDQVAFNQQINAICIDENKVNPLYLAYAIKAREDELRALANAAVVPIVNKSQFGSFALDIDPNLRNQNEVVARLKAVETQQELMEMIIECLDSLVKSRFVEMFERQEYSKVPISDLVISKMPLAKDTFGDTDLIRYIDISSIDNSVGEVMGFTEYIFGEAPSRAQQCIGSGDILVSTVRPNLKNAAVSKFDGDNLVVSSGFCVLRCVGCSVEYMKAIVRSDQFTREMCQLATGANYPAIKKRDVLEYMIPNPPMRQMNEFTVFVQQVDKLRFAIQEQIEKLETLKASLMQEHFG